MARNPNDPNYQDGLDGPQTDLNGQTNQPAGYGDVQGYYTKYLGRAANADDPNKWLTGAYGYGTDLPTIENAIKNSDEAKAYAAKQGAGGGGGAQPPAGGVPSDYDLAQAMMQRLNAPGQTMSYQDMVNEFNKGYGTDYQAYNDSRGQLVGFHTGYLSKEPNGWAWTARGPEGNSAPPPGTNVNGMLQGSADSQWNQFLKAQTDQLNQNNAMRDQFRQAILSRLSALTGNSSETDPNGPELSPILQAYHLQSQRGLQDTRNAIAERNYAQGTLGTGGFDQQQQRALEDAGAAEAGFTGTQVSNAVMQRQAQLQHLLDAGAGFLSQGDQQGAQAQLADLSAQLQRAQLQQQQGQFGDTLGFNYTQLQAMLNQQALLQALAGRG
jgi:hypothetical protein